MDNIVPTNSILMLTPMPLQFEIEQDAEPIKCTCGAKTCRGRLN